MTSVTPVTRDHIVISLSPGFTAAVFKLADGGGECIVLDNTGTECTRFGIAPAEKGKELDIVKTVGRIDVYYRTKAK